MKKQKRSKFGLILTICMTVYAIVFVCIAYQGFCWFWDYIDAYEKSRPQNTIDAYMEQLDTAHVQAACETLIAGIDHNIQSVESCGDAIADALKGGFSYAKNVKESTENTMVYMILTNGKTIGRVTLTSQQADQFGFTPWTVTKDSFDLSYLVGEGSSITVPHNYTVYANGVQLSADYITESNIPYQLVKDYYDAYEPPYMVTYTVAPIMGQLHLTVADPEGNTVTAEAWEDEVTLLSGCTETERGEIKDFMDDFITAYVNYTSNKDKARQANYAALYPYLVPGSSLQERMLDALDGLRWVTDRYPHINSINVLQQIPFLDGRILCNVEYTVRSVNDVGQYVTQTYSVQVILTEAGTGYLAESMYSN